jgi:transcription elongation factor S-II
MSARNLARDRLGRILPSDVADEVERHLYNKMLEDATAKEIPLYWESPDFTALYKNKLRSLLFNLSNPKNPGLVASVRVGDTTPERLLQMTPQEMDPGLWKPYYDRIAAKELLRSNDVVPEGILQCGRCKSKRVVWYQMQTRSADEPMTVFATCSECGKRWKS